MDLLLDRSLGLQLPNASRNFLPLSLHVDHLGGQSFLFLEQCGEAGVVSFGRVVGQFVDLRLEGPDL